MQGRNNVGRWSIAASATPSGQISPQLSQVSCGEDRSHIFGKGQSWWLWSGQVTQIGCLLPLSPNLALPTATASPAPKGHRTALAAKVGALVRFKRAAARTRTADDPTRTETAPRTEPATENEPNPDSTAATRESTSAAAMYQTPYAPPPKQGHKAWWNHFTLNPKPKKSDTAALEGPYRAEDNADHPVFGKPLKESLKYASVQISTANANGELYVWGYIPVVVAKCGLYLKENATEVPGTFRVSGSNKRMRELQAVFETPPRYGKSLDWKKESYTTHDVASVFRRYLTQMPEPVIPYDMYHLFRDAIAKEPFNQEEAIATYKSLIRRMPRPNQYLLLYVLDLLSVFARKSDKNLMTATNLAVIFRPGIISHPSHEMSPQEHALSQKVLEFLIAQQDWFMLDISPPTPPRHSESYEGGPSSSRGGSGGNGSGGNGGEGSGQGGQDGNGGRWRENTTSPSRQGTGDNNGTTGGGGGGGTPTQNAAWHSSMTTNAEAGPSRQRRLTLPDRSGSFPLQSSHPHTTAGGAHSHSLSQWSGSLAYAPPPNSPSPQPHPQSHSQSQTHSQPQPPPQAPTQHRRQRSISHSPTRSAEKQAMLAIMAGHTYAQGPREPHPREPHQREAREPQQREAREFREPREPKEPKEGQFSEHVWSNSSSLPPSPTSGSFPTGSNAVTTPSRHAKSPSAVTNANANGTSNANANASASATPIYSRFSHPPQTTQMPANGYEQTHGYGYGYGEHQQRPMASASPSHHHQHPSQSQSHSHLQTQNPYYHLPQGAQPPSHSSPPHSHQLTHHQPSPHRQPSPSHPPHPPFHAPIPTTNSDVDEHMIIPSSPSSPPLPHERPSSPLSEDDVSIAPFGGEGGGLGGGWKLVRTPVPSPGALE
ncbi:hypothetical protein CVT26_005711, partial [Gymnopilus dilepis]